MPPKKYKARNQEMIYKESGKVPGRPTYKLVEAPSDPVSILSKPDPDQIDQGTSTPIVTKPHSEDPCESFPVEGRINSDIEENVPKQSRRGKVSIYEFCFKNTYSEQ